MSEKVLKRIFCVKEESRIDSLIHKKKAEIINTYNVKRKVFPNGKQEYYIYNFDVESVPSGFELYEDSSNSSFQSCINDIVKKPRNSSGEFSKSNLTKSFRMLSDYCKANESDFKTFVTLTFKDNVKNLDYANKKFSYWVTNFRKECLKYGYELKYLGVPEFQKRGAVHYHLLLNIPVNTELIPLQEGKKNSFDVKYWSHGFSSAFDLSLTDDKFNVTKYISKYFWKDVDNRLFGRQKILKSNNLNKPIVETYYMNDLDTFYLDLSKANIDECYSYNAMSILKFDNDEENYCLPF